MAMDPSFECRDGHAWTQQDNQHKLLKRPHYLMPRPRARPNEDASNNIVESMDHNDLPALVLFEEVVGQTTGREIVKYEVRLLSRPDPPANEDAIQPRSRRTRGSRHSHRASTESTSPLRKASHQKSHRRRRDSSSRADSLENGERRLIRLPPPKSKASPSKPKPAEFDVQLCGQQHSTRTISPPRSRRRPRPRLVKSSSFQSRPEQLLQVYQDLARKELISDLHHLEETQFTIESDGTSTNDEDYQLHNDSMAVLSDTEDSSFCRDDSNTDVTPIMKNLEPEARKVGTYDTAIVKFQHSRDCQDHYHPFLSPCARKLGGGSNRARTDSIEDGQHTLATVASTASASTDIDRLSFLLNSDTETPSPVKSLQSHVSTDNSDLVDTCFEDVDAIGFPFLKDTSELETTSFRLSMLQKQIEYLQPEPTPDVGVPPAPLANNLPPQRDAFVEHTLETIRKRRERFYNGGVVSREDEVSGRAKSMYL